MDSEYGVNTRRMAARGNATSFALPWQDVLAQLSAAEPDLQNAGEKSLVALPRTGSQLAEIVSGLSKASGDDEYVGALSKFIHQATVRREAGPAGTELKERTSAGAALSSSEMGRPSAHGAALARAPRLHSGVELPWRSQAAQARAHGCLTFQLVRLLVRVAQ